jgi:hypothetical protein
MRPSNTASAGVRLIYWYHYLHMVGSGIFRKTVKQEHMENAFYFVLLFAICAERL